MYVSLGNQIMDLLIKIETLALWPLQLPAPIVMALVLHHTAFSLKRILHSFIVFC